MAWRDNPRKNDGAVKRVAESIRRFGFGAPIVARRANGEIIAGHTRWRAANLLGLERVPVRLLDIDEREAHALALADNKLGEIAEWDSIALGTQLSAFSLSDAGLLGWSGRELSDLARESGVDEAQDRSGGDLTYCVLVNCADESEQSALLERFEIEGLNCKPLIT